MISTIVLSRKRRVIRNIFRINAIKLITIKSIASVSWQMSVGRCNVQKYNNVKLMNSRIEMHNKIVASWMQINMPRTYFSSADVRNLNWKNIPSLAMKWMSEFGEVFYYSLVIFILCKIFPWNFPLDEAP